MSPKIVQPFSLMKLSIYTWMHPNHPHHIREVSPKLKKNITTILLFIDQLTDTLSFKD